MVGAAGSSNRQVVGNDLVIPAFCQVCGNAMMISRSTERFCSELCKQVFEGKISKLRKKRRNEYQRQFRSNKYKTEVKHLQKIECPKCKLTGYLVRYTVRNRETQKVVSVYETVRHQVTEGGKSVLKGQCYLRSLSTSERIQLEAASVPA